MIRDIVIGKPLVNIEVLGIENPYYTENRQLHEILIELGVFKSKQQIKKNRPDLIKELNELDCIDLKVGKNRFYIVVGEWKDD